MTNEEMHGRIGLVEISLETSPVRLVRNGQRAFLLAAGRLFS